MGSSYPIPLGINPSSVDIDGGTLPRIESPRPGPIGLNGDDAGAARKGGSTAVLGPKVLQFARERLGRRIGDGECFALADQALRHVRAKSAADFGPVTEEGDYVWGTAISLSDVQPGDIVQFRDYEYVRREEKDDGSWKERSESRPHHTAIVVSVDGNGMLTVIDQNAPKGSVVRAIQLGFSDSTTRKGSTTIRVTVTGQVWFYRPQAR